LFLTIPEESDETVYVILANLSYNFKTSENLMLFVLGGAGYGNGSRLFDFVLDNDMGVTVYNFGAGIKYLVGNSAALRIEYRFTKYSGEKTESYSWGTWTDKLDRTDNNVLLGVSIFF
jgi:opacity protein-like surface antigen